MIKWDATGVLLEISEAAQDASKEVADNFVKDLKQNLSKHGGGGRISSRIMKKRSKFKHGGHVVTIAPKPTGKWEDSPAGRAWFFEYGRSAPGKGKSKGGPQPEKARAQPPRQFIRPAKKKNKRKAREIFLRHLT